MPIEWNIAEDVSLVYRYSGGSWTKYLYYQTNSGIDIFTDNFAADDCFYFICNGYPSERGIGYSSHAHKFKGLQLEVDIPIQADTYEYVWEYYSSNGWKPLPNINDPSNGLSIEGTHTITWDIPNDWICANRPCNNDYWSSGWVVRLRVTNVVNPSEGGKFGTSQTIKQLNYAYTIRDGNEYSLEDLFDLDQSLGNNLITKCDNFYKVMANIAIRDGKLYIEPYSTLVVGNLNYESGYNITGGFEILQDGYGVIECEGGYIEWNNSFYQGRYNYWNGILNMSKGSYIRKAFGGYVAWTIACELDIEDSQIASLYSSDTIYFHSRSHGTVKRSNIITCYFYMYTGKIEWIDVQMKTLANITTNNRLLGGTSQFKIYMENFDFKNEIQLYSTQGAEMMMVNPKNLNESKITLGNTYGKYNNAAWIGYKLNLKVIDEKGNPIQDARVFIRDKNNHSAIIKDWGKTDGWYCYGLSYDYTTSGYFRKYDKNLSSYIYKTPPFLSVGDIFRLRGEYIKITNLYSNGIFTCERNQTYKGYTSIGYPAGYSTSPIYTEEEFITTNELGEAKFTGEFGKFNPIIINKLYIEDKNDNRQDREYRPFTIIVAKEGYEPITIPIDPKSEINLIVKLSKSEINTDMEVIPT